MPPKFDPNDVTPFETPPPSGGGVSAGPGPKFNPNDVTPYEPPPEEERAAPIQDTLDDVLRALPGAAVKTGLRTVGQFTGDVRETNAAIVNWLSKKLGYEVSPETASRILRYMPGLGGISPGAPSSKEMIAMAERLHGGKFYEAKTPEGKLAEFGTELLPAMAGGPEGFLARLGPRFLSRVVFPAMAGQSLENLTKGTAFEPYAKPVGAIGATLMGGLPGLVRAALPAGRRAAQAEVEAARVAQEAEGAGVTLTGPQARGSQAELAQVERARRGEFGDRAQQIALEHEARQGTQIEQAGTALGEEATGAPVRPLADVSEELGQEVQGPAQRFKGAIDRIEQSVQQRAQEEAARRTRILDLQRETFLSTFGEQHPVGTAVEAAERIGSNVQQRAGRLQLAGSELPQPRSEDVAKAVRKIVADNSTPEEMAAALTGGKKGGQSGRSVRLAEYLGDVFGRDSDTWHLVQQAVVRKAMDVKETSANNLFALADSSLGKQVFRPSDLNTVRGMAQSIREADAAVTNINASTTERVAKMREGWQRLFQTDAKGITGDAYHKLVNGDMNPGEVVRTVLTAISRGAPRDSARFIASVRRMYGEDSPQVALIREGVFDKLFHSPAGQELTREVVAQNITRFINSPVARSLYTDQHIAQMRRFAQALERTVSPSDVPRFVREGFLSRTRNLIVDALVGGVIYGAGGSLLHAAMGGIGAHAITHAVAHAFWRNRWARSIDRVALKPRDVRRLVEPYRYRDTAPDIAPAAITAGTQQHLLPSLLPATGTQEAEAPAP